MSNALYKSVCRAMERIAPLRLAENLTSSVLTEALEKETSVIVAYHPAIFKGLQSLTLSNPLQRSLLQCAAEGISVYSPHTALDSVWGGINDWLARGLAKEGEGKVEPLVGQKMNPTSGEPEGAEGRLVTLETPVKMKELERRIKAHLKLEHLQVGYPDGAREEPSTVQTIAICAGSGGSMLLGKPADVYFTGEMSHHEVLAAVAAGKHVVLCGHTNTERGYLPTLANKLKEQLAEDQVEGVELIVSEKDRHPLDIV
ncbi:NGG1 interacting factor 3 [Coprinopsis sp. MPI-PUGE-AT-0042]|nr:NGG1 interacting factor 3 [Coprinopsis sp. MPI-PUGE-AT-0042]